MSVEEAFMAADDADAQGEGDQAGSTVGRWLEVALGVLVFAMTTVNLAGRTPSVAFEAARARPDPGSILLLGGMLWAVAFIGIVLLRSRNARVGIAIGVAGVALLAWGRGVGRGGARERVEEYGVIVFSPDVSPMVAYIGAALVIVGLMLLFLQSARGGDAIVRCGIVATCIVVSVASVIHGSDTSDAVVGHFIEVEDTVGPSGHG